MCRVDSILNNGVDLVAYRVFLLEDQSLERCTLLEGLLQQSGGGTVLRGNFDGVIELRVHIVGQPR